MAVSMLSMRRPVVVEAPGASCMCRIGMGVLRARLPPGRAARQCTPGQCGRFPRPERCCWSDGVRRWWKLCWAPLCVCVRVVRNGVVVADYMDFNGWRVGKDEGMRLGRRDGLAFALSIACTWLGDLDLMPRLVAPLYLLSPTEVHQSSSRYSIYVHHLLLTCETGRRLQMILQCPTDRPSIMA